MNQTKLNANTVTKELEWLKKIIKYRMEVHFSEAENKQGININLPPDISTDKSEYASRIKRFNVSFDERIILILALAPHIAPHTLDVFYIKNSASDRGYTEFGGIKGVNHNGFIPTGETAAFIVANSAEEKFNLYKTFSADHFFRKFNILKLIPGNQQEPFLSGTLSISKEYLTYFTIGNSFKPDFDFDFPAKLIQTGYEWNELVLDEVVLDEVNEINMWIKHKDTLLNTWELKDKIKAGYRTLFYGPPGTGKTLTATLIGKSTGLDVYRIDLSLIVSKYIGETEKNLGNVFDQAENKNWILFFDEADSIFGKRTQTSSANDKYANQEVSYLLQRIEDFPGIIILATNLKANIDDAFSRRFQSMIYFPLPNEEQRLRLWEQAFSSKTAFEDKVNLKEIAAKYELSGGAITNIIRYTALKAVERNSNIILNQDLVNGIKREFGKEGKIV